MRLNADQQQTSVQEKLDRMDAWTLDNRLKIALEALRCPPEETQVSVISGGERRRVALCRLLLTEPDILLLDEPTNHLDAESVAWLEQHLKRYKGTVIAVPMIVISLTMLPSGFSNSIVDSGYRGAGIIPLGSNRKKCAWSTKKKVRVRDKKPSSVNLNGSTCPPKPVKPRERQE
jgi:hypothetical protein